MWWIRAEGLGVAYPGRCVVEAATATKQETRGKSVWGRSIVRAEVDDWGLEVGTSVLKGRRYFGA